MASLLVFPLTMSFQNSNDMLPLVRWRYLSTRGHQIKIYGALRIIPRDYTTEGAGLTI